MSNTVDIIIKEQTITVTPQNVQGLVRYAEGGYAVIFEDGTSLSITEDNYNAIKALNYSGGGGGEGGIQSSTINNMEFDGDKTLTINGTPFEGGGSSMVLHADNTLTGAKNEAGEDVTMSIGTITITI